MPWAKLSCQSDISNTGMSVRLPLTGKRIKDKNDEIDVLYKMKGSFQNFTKGSRLLLNLYKTTLEIFDK